MTNSQRRHLLSLVDSGPFVETFNGRRTWVRNRKGISSRVLFKLATRGLVTVVQATGRQEFTITDAGRAALTEQA